MKDQILKTALQLFNEQGYMEVGMRQIARQLGISPGNLTYHFKKKEELLFALLNRFSEQNNSIFTAYLAAEPDLHNFLSMMDLLFNSQYEYRGVFIGNQVVQAELKDKDRFNYREVEKRRKGTYVRIFRDLGRVGQLAVNEEDISFLLSFITLFARFWLSEATLFDRSPSRGKTIVYYLQLLAKELSLFATPAGRERIAAFVQGVGRHSRG